MEAQQLAIYIGWLLNGVRGGLVAGVLFVLPGVLALLALSAVYVGAGESGPVTALFAGLGAAVLAIGIQEVVRVGEQAFGHLALVILAVMAFLALFVFGVHSQPSSRSLQLSAGRWVAGYRGPCAPPQVTGTAQLDLQRPLVGRAGLEPATQGL